MVKLLLIVVVSLQLNWTLFSMSDYISLFSLISSLSSDGQVLPLFNEATINDLSIFKLYSSWFSVTINNFVTARCVVTCLLLSCFFYLLFLFLSLSLILSSLMIFALFMIRYTNHLSICAGCREKVLESLLTSCFLSLMNKQHQEFVTRSSSPGFIRFFSF